MTDYLDSLVGNTGIKVKCTLDDIQVLSKGDAHVAIFLEDDEVYHSEVMTEGECFQYVDTYGFAGVIPAIEYLIYSESLKMKQKTSSADASVKGEPAKETSGGGSAAAKKKTIVVPDDTDSTEPIGKTVVVRPTPEGMWTCSICYYNNLLGSEICRICGADESSVF